MTCKTSRTIIHSILALPVAFGMQMAAAQTNDDSGFAIEEIIVTAQKREQSLQEVPLAVTAIGAAQLREARITGVADVAMRTPNFSVTEYSLGQPGLSIRGIVSNEDGAAGDNSVAVFLDGVYLARGSSQLTDLYDLERIEVLRGPQGTLWGKNATAGAVSIVTRRPDENFRASIEATAGNLGRAEVKGLVSGAVGESTYGSISFSHRERDGHTTNQLTGEEMMNEDATSARAKLLFVPSDTLEILFGADFTTNDLAGDARIPIGGAAGPIANAAGGGENNPRVSLADNPGFSDRDVWGLSANIQWSAGIGDLTSITAYREAEFSHLADPLGMNPAMFFIEGIDGEEETSEQFSQEFRLTNETDTLRWVTGFYYLNEDAKRIETIDPELLPPLTPLPIRSVNIFDQANETDSFAIFGDLTFFLSDQWNLNIGLRYTDEEKNYTHSSADSFIGPLLGGAIPAPLPGSLQQELFTINATESWDAVTGRIAVDYTVNDDIMVFGSVARGFKSGGFPGQPDTAEAASTPFDPEFNLSYEAGIKSMWADNRFLLNANVFFMDYDDIQVTTLVSTPTNPVGSLITSNAGAAEIKGLEVEWTWQLSEAVSLYGMYAYLDTEVTEAVDTAVIGSKMQNAPENKFSFGTELNYPVGANSEITARASYSYQDDLADGNTDDPSTFIPSHEVIDARIAYSNLEKGFEVAVWGKNLADETYRIQAFSVAGGGFALFAPPRTYGVTVSWRYE